MNKVLVTDGEDRHSLAIVRSLGRQGMDITSLAHDPNAITFLSRYVAKRITSPLSQNAREYGDFLLNEVRTGGYDVLVVCTEPVINILHSRHAEFEPYVKFALPPSDSLAITKDKIETLKLGESIGIPLPRTVFPESVEDALARSREFELPFIIKGSRGSGAANVRVVRSRERIEPMYLEVVENLRNINVHTMPMLQEFVEGTGFGFSTIYSKGKKVTHFMHERLLQYPSAAGQAVAARQVFDERLDEIGTKMFDALKWHSVGMAEFRKDIRDGEYKLMEINPRFWGSVDLPIRLGIDFADYYYRLALHGELDPVVQQNGESKDFLFLFPHAFVSFLESPRQFRQIYRNLHKGATLTDFDSKDRGPLLRQLRLTVWHMRKHLRKFGFRNLEKGV
jgi:predicted ATP-grasp superfamily ATP-dependent carboligase